MTPNDSLADLQLSFPEAADVVAAACLTPNRTLATAESCTGGLLGAALTAVPGSSVAYLGGVVAYANAVKVTELGVDPGLLERFGAVSSEVAEAMAAGVRARLAADFGIGVTGVAGPGSSDAKPAGLIYVTVAGPGRTVTTSLRSDHGRHGNRVEAVTAALRLLLGELGR
ncbi:MAG TPA: nicotinamide-nucleotide amidohydrolase family protein [Candidatus Nanopelagicaceae bacterium]|nr:nicotinamide-nucleotide amidohydrolase family protein [Candidatus Nanopelagicaceae bacterium]